MTNLAQIKETIADHNPTLKKKFGVKKIGIFGSYAHGTQSEGSDIDILVDLERNLGWDIIDLKIYLEDILGKEVDLVTVNALKPRLKDTILKDVVYT